MTSTDISPYSLVHMEPVNAYPLDDDSSSSCTVMYDDLVRSSDLFWEKLKALLGYSALPLNWVPTMGGKTLDLHQLFIEVTSRGGMEQVIRDRKWKEVIGTFNFRTTVTSGSFVLRKYYLKFLQQMEHVYYLRNPVPSIQSSDEAMKSLANVSPNPEEGIDERQIVVQGFIDGKFDTGYLVTVKVGSEELRGVLFQIPQTPSQPQGPQQNLETSAVIVPPSSQNRHKKRSRLALVDPQKPKSSRCGYNFYFAEHYSRLYPEYERHELTKMIGQMWSNLTVSEKQVYQEKGVKDVERYRNEMLEYKSSHDQSGAAATSASTSATATVAHQ